jgi:hypothetical protein
MAAPVGMGSGVPVVVSGIAGMQYWGGQVVVVLRVLWGEALDWLP